MLAEREGFEPPEPLSSTVFKTAAIDHSAISPSVYATHFLFKSGAKIQSIFDSANLFVRFFKKRFFLPYFCCINEYVDKVNIE